MVLIVSNADTSLPALLTPPVTVDPKYRILDNLTDEQSKCIKELQERIKDMFAMNDQLHGIPLKDEEAWATTNECSWRFLKANRFDIDKTEAALIKTLQWRREFRPTEITPEEIEEESKDGKAFWSGYDRTGRPIMHLTSANSSLPTLTLSDLKGFLFSILRTIPSFALRESFNLSIPDSIKLVSTIQTHYPETLGCSIDFDPTWVMWALLSMMMTLMDDNTRSKMFLASSKPGGGKKEAVNSKAKETGGWLNHVQDLVELDQLPIYLGGTYSIQYDHSLHWKPFVKRVWNQ
ncbi:CRAL-TRIO domain-containing protein [Obelidium mucronatum]|nr:CRAL-TRIO domain-containing protein [Obelidium mucronatum]